MRPAAHRIRLVAAILLLAALEACSLHRGAAPSFEEQAESAIAEGDTARAKRYLEDAVHERYPAPQSFMRLGELYRADNTIRSRRRSQEVLEDGLRRYPDHPGLRLELGKTLYRQTFYPDAQRCFERVLELDPSSCEAHYYLGLNEYRRWKHVQVWERYLVEAKRRFERVVECAPDNARAFYLLAFSLYALDNPIGATEVCRRFIDLHPDDPRPYFLLAVMAFENELYELADDMLRGAFSLVTEEEEDAMSSIAYLLDEDEADEYERTSLKRRQEWRREFWAEHDPDLTTHLNERQLEHLYRMFLADAFYYHEKPRLRGWETERGRALVKFGWPMATGTTLEGTFLSGRMEVWTYENGFTFFFRDEFLNGNYMVPMDYKYAYAAQTLYLEDPQTEIIDESIPIPAFMDLVTFRNTPYSSDVYVTVKVDLDSIDNHVSLDDADSFFSRTAFFTEAWEPFFYHADTLKSERLAEEGRKDRGWIHLVNSFELPFDYHRVAFCLEDQWAATRSLIRAETSTLGYFSDTLTVSDILLHRRPADEASGAFIRRGGRSFFPNPGGAYTSDEKVRLYLEIYNLDVLGARSEYDITYSIFEPRDKKKSAWAKLKAGLKYVTGFRSPPEPVISQTIHREGGRHQAEEDLAIDVAALEPGEYVLRVSVFDVSSGRRAERTAGFVKQPAR